jgi:hypothetical protein
MQPYLATALLIVLFSGCTTPYQQHEGLAATEAMTDMNGVPISPGRNTAVGVGIGIGSWGGRVGGGVGIGLGF